MKNGGSKLSLWFVAWTAAALVLGVRIPVACEEDRYSRADAVALAVKYEPGTSVATLARALTAGLTSDEERARAIFRWIAENVSYSAGRAASNGGADAVLRSRTAACEGYAGLFAAICRALGLEAEVIGGYSKGYHYRAGGALSLKPDHAWNAVKIGGVWRLVDCTWGSGYLDDSGRFHRLFNGHYFMTPPEEFIFDHFPEDPRWQLLARPLSREEYQQLVMVRPPFFRYGLRPVSHRQAEIRLRGPGSVTMGAPENVALMARLYSGDTEVAGTPVFVRRSSNAEVLINPPAAGAYRLRLFAKSCDSSDPYEWAAEYSIKAEAAGEPDAYPRAYEAYYRRSVCLDGPVRGRLPAGQPVSFRIRVPEASQVALVSGDEWTFLEEKENWREGTVVPKRGPLQLAAAF
ncbi:MAG: transglutaminase domain-containing protein, partial [Armatimonadota bacterium]